MKRETGNQHTRHVKVVVFCPKDAADTVRRAITDAGGGRIGNYDSCVSATESTGYFRPLPGAHPAIGQIGRVECVEEVKLEFVCDRADAPRIIVAMKAAHPYEEVAYDVILLCDL